MLLGRKERQQRKKEKNVTLQKEKRQGITTRGSKRPNHNSTTKEKEVINTNTTTKKTNAKEKEKEKSIAQNKEADKRPGRTPTPPIVPSVSSLSLTFLSSLNSFPFFFNGDKRPSPFTIHRTHPRNTISFRLRFIGFQFSFVFTFSFSPATFPFTAVYPPFNFTSRPLLTSIFSTRTTTFDFIYPVYLTDVHATNFRSCNAIHLLVSTWSRSRHTPPSRRSLA